MNTKQTEGVHTGYSLCLPGPRISSRTVVENTPISVWLQHNITFAYDYICIRVMTSSPARWHHWSDARWMIWL